MTPPAETPAAPVEHQYKVRLSPETTAALLDQADHLGFHTSNSLAAALLTAFAKVPPRKVWQALADLEAYAPAPARARRR